MEESSYFVDPPPATSWPDPKSTPEYQAQAAWQLQQNDQDDPVPGVYTIFRATKIVQIGINLPKFLELV
jgi:hypothetical protein